MDYKNYIWDLGGTLLDNYESSTHAFAATIWKMSERVVLHDEVYAALKISTAHAVETFAADLPDFLKNYKALEAETLRKPILFNDAQLLLETIKKNNSQNFMISHRDKQVLDILSAANIKQYFTEVVTADDGFPRKPAPDSILYLLKKYQLNPKETVMIGDRSIDIEAGNAAKVNTIFFDPKASLSIATKNIKSLSELL
ncbi:HAD-IA family hydrolase [Lactococcus nasutitermitis]|uniref:HAD-IA family hydrolase n=1 Tax=Lactococcus nasutitermitis TaxID=1652957 RepID=A0ABV9JGC0_9LACT|nr:HAD-IA family hydrolase [Lactococcus nasutitermitis]